MRTQASKSKSKSDPSHQVLDETRKKNTFFLLMYPGLKTDKKM